MRKTINVFLVLILLFGFVGYANGEDFERIADDLNHLGLFKGTDKGYELDKALTRAEGITLISRLLESEESIKGSNYWHPFKDVPKWADKSVGCMYYRGMVKGISRDKLGSDNYMSAKDFTTFILRVLWYNDSEGDFTWENSLDKAVEIGLYNEDYKKDLETKEFLRKDAVYVMQRALVSCVNDDPVKPTFLIQFMYNNKLLTNNQILEVPSLNVINTVDKNKSEFKDDKVYIIRGGGLEYKNNKIYSVLNGKLYVFENDKLVDESKGLVSDIFIGEKLYYIGDCALYQSDLNDVNKTIKIADLDQGFRYEIAGEYGGNIYLYKISTSSYSRGEMDAIIEKVNINNGRVELEQDGIKSQHPRVEDGKLYYVGNMQDVSDMEYLKIKDLESGETNFYSNGDYVNTPIVGDSQVVINMGNIFKMLDTKTWESVDLYARTGNIVLAFHKGWVYTYGYNDITKIIRFNIYTGEAQKVIDDGMNVGAVLPTDNGIYWCGYIDDKTHLFKTNFEGRDKTTLQ